MKRNEIVFELTFRLPKELKGKIKDEAVRNLEFKLTDDLWLLDPRGNGYTGFLCELTSIKKHIVLKKKLRKKK